MASNADTSKTKEKISIYTKLQNIDERYLYVLVFALIGIALLYPMNIPVSITKNTKNLYNFIENLPPGSKVLIGSEMTSGLWGEYGVMATAVLDHLFQKDVNIYFVSFRYSGSLILTRDLVLPVIDDGNHYGKKYGEDWVDIGYIPGAESAMIIFGTDIRETTSTDYLGTSLNDIPVMEGVNVATDFDFVMVLGGSISIQYIRQFPGKWDLPMGSGTSALNYPKWLPYVATGQIVGILNGIRGGAEYEFLLGKPGLGHGTDYTDGLNLVFMMIFAFIILGNVGYIYEKFKKGVNR